MVLLSLGGALITGGTLMTKLFNTKFFSFFFFSSYQEPKARRATVRLLPVSSSTYLKRYWTNQKPLWTSLGSFSRALCNVSILIIGRRLLPYGSLVCYRSYRRPTVVYSVHVSYVWIYLFRTAWKSCVWGHHQRCRVYQKYSSARENHGGSKASPPLSVALHQ